MIYDLLDCNLDNIDLFKVIGKDGVDAEIRRYEDVTRTERNYHTVAPTLAHWYGRDKIVYPEPYGHTGFILDAVKKHRPKTILEAGAGCGRIAKMVYDVMDGNIDLYCVENNKLHWNQMNENFITMQYEPKRVIKANTFHGSITSMPQFEDGQLDFVYTHTVMMHIAYLSALMTAIELARVTSKYICHVENKDDKRCVYPKNTPEFNKLRIDYRKLYGKLGFETEVYEEVSIGFGNTACYLGRKK